MALTQCAVFYATASKHLRFKVLPDDDADLTRLQAPVGHSVLLTATVATPRGQGCPDDATCRQLIAMHTGTAVLAGNADRCCVIDGTNTVIGVIKADPALDTVPGHILILHGLADIGDTWTGTAFQRRYAIASGTTGIVASVVLAAPGAPPATAAGQFAVPAPTAAVGATVPLPKHLAGAVGSI